MALVTVILMMPTLLLCNQAGVKQPQQFAGGPLNFVVCQVRSSFTLL